MKLFCAITKFNSKQLQDFLICANISKISNEVFKYEEINMPNIKSAKKRVKVSARQNKENTMKKSRVKNAVKKYNDAIAANDVALASALLPETMAVIDAATSDGVYHKNTAARKKATLCRSLDKIKNN